MQGFSGPTLKYGNNYANRAPDNKSVEILDQIIPDSEKDKAFGCVLGAFIGDACGSFVEFSPKMIEDSMMDLCLKMPGGGPHKGIASG